MLREVGYAAASRRSYASLSHGLLLIYNSREAAVDSLLFGLQHCGSGKNGAHCQKLAA